jgi:RNA polymerase sigma-70 factor, ECF subfamily
MTEDSDEALMRAIAQGDEAAFRALAHRHLERIRRLARKMLGGPAEADDVAQETLLRIWQRAADWRPERSQLTTWIYTIVYRLSVDRLRRPRTVPLDHAMDTTDPKPSALDSLAAAGDLRRLAAAMQALQPRQHAALTLFYYEEMNGPDAAAVLGLSLRAFWSLLHRARQAVQQRLHVASTSQEDPA